MHKNIKHYSKKDWITDTLGTGNKNTLSMNSQRVENAKHRFSSKYQEILQKSDTEIFQG